jgi:hypothetical protein
MNSDASADLFALGRAASEQARRTHDGRGWIACWRRLRPDGTWQGMASAACAWVEERDLEAVGGMAGARSLGANALVGTSLPLLARAQSQGMRGILRWPALDESPEEQLRRLKQLNEQMRAGLPVDGVAPEPGEDTLGIATLILVAHCRLFLSPGMHVMVDLERLGPKLGQLCLGFGADELFGPIVSERPVRLGDHAGSREITRHEAAQLLRGAGLRPFERVGQGQTQEFVP